MGRLRDNCPSRVGVVGGGVVGLAIASSLQRRGHAVSLFDRDEPGQGCSHGNAAVIATSLILPLSSPRYLLAGPKMLLDPLGPLAIRSRDLPKTAPWLLRFALNAAPRRQRRTIEALKAINGQALRSWRAVLEDAGAPSLMAERGMLEIVAPTDGASLRSLAGQAARLSAEQISVHLLNSDEVAELEPVFAGRTGGGLFHRDVAQVTDPSAVNTALLNAFLGHGGTVVRRIVERLEPAEDGVVIHGRDGTSKFDHVVVAAGFWSGALLERLGVAVPIGVERGYHLMIRDAVARPARPIIFHKESFALSPVADGIRLAGTVEIAAPDSVPDWRRADILSQLAHPYLPISMDGPRERWMGCRPSFPDSLPAIGRLKTARRILYAFGHQHLGLTQAAITAEAIGSLFADAPPPFALAPFSLDRFAGSA